MTIGRYAQVNSIGAVNAICMTDIADEFVTDGYHDAINAITFVSVPEGIDNITLIESYRYINNIWLNLGLKPSCHHIYDETLKSWVFDIVSARAAKWLDIKTARNKQEISGFHYLGKQIDSDYMSVSRISSAAQSANISIQSGIDFSIRWTCADNSILVLDGPGMMSMHIALTQHISDIHEKAAAFRLIISESNEVSLSAISW
jgi:hypothetical protein